MEFRPIYILGFIVYGLLILLGYSYYGAGGASLAGIAGPAIVLLVNAIRTGESIEDEKHENQQEQESFVETREQRKRRAISRLDDHLTLRENTAGEIELHRDMEDIRGADRMAMLYVFGQWAKAEADPRYSPIVTKSEIRENTSHKGRAVGVFLNKMAHFIKRHYPEDQMEPREIDEEDMEFELDEDYLEETLMCSTLLM